MSFSDWLIIGGAALLIKHGMKKEAANKKSADEEYYNYISDLREREAEWNRRSAVNSKRRNMPCFFVDGLSFTEFEEMAKRAGRKIKRIKDVTVNEGRIYCNVESQTGYSDWNFNVDFNDWGHVTGTYWTQTDNDDSSIPSHYGQMLSGWIHDFYRERGISLLDLSDFVDENKDLETGDAFNYSYKEKFLKKIFGKSNDIVMKYATDMFLGEHLYPVISMLRENGFKNIKVLTVKDINDNSSGFYYMVEKVVINGIGCYDAGTIFPENAEVYITYHEKQTIRMPFSRGELRRKNYINVGDWLLEQGFTQIFERKIEDLVTGWITKEGSVENVLLDGDENRPIEKNAIYDYDQKIVICYHTKRR